MKSLLFILIGLLVSISSLLAEGPVPITNDLLARLRAEAVRNHPAVAAAKLKAVAANRDIGAVRLWDDPTAGLMVMAAERMMRRDDGDVRLSVEQALPKPGLYAANRAKAEAMSRAEDQNIRVSALARGSAAAKTAIELALADEVVATQALQIPWLKRMAENARQRSINPGETSVDALRLETELAREEEILQAARRTRDSIAQRLNLILGRPLDRAWPTMRLPERPVPVPVAKSEIARIPRVSPRILAMKEVAAAAAADTRIADRERQPGFSLGVETSLYSGGDIRSATVGAQMTLPWFNEPSYRAKIDAAHAREKASLKDTEAETREIADGVLIAVNEAANAGAQAQAYSGDIFTKATAATTSLEGSWITSKALLTDLLDANRMLFSIRLEQRRFVAMQLAALEDLYLLVPPL